MPEITVLVTQVDQKFKVILGYVISMKPVLSQEVWGILFLKYKFMHKDIK